MSTPGLTPAVPLKLEFPQSLAVYDDYAKAQKSVDFLADADFSVDQLMIVGTELNRIERVTGRLTWSKVAVGGILSGPWLGIFVGLIFTLFTEEGLWQVLLSTALMGSDLRPGLGPPRLRLHPRPARLLVRHAGGGDEVRGARREQVRRPGARTARRAARCAARRVRVTGVRAEKSQS